VAERSSSDLGVRVGAVTGRCLLDQGGPGEEAGRIWGKYYVAGALNMGKISTETLLC